MITKIQKLKLQQYLRKDWVPQVLKELERNKIISSRGKPYSESMIRMVFIGKIEQLDIERAIFVVYLQRKHEYESIEQEKERILDIKDY